MSHYEVTAQYRQDIHANVDADSNEDAVRKANALFEKWLETMDADVEGISFGPEGASLDDDVLVSEARSPTQQDPSYWTDGVELSIYDIVERTQT